jgi:thiol-disulfide isomerase/thioredoxin
MTPLQTQEQFETTIWNKTNPAVTVDRPTVLYFTAKWCGACKRLNWQTILNALPNTPFYKCDVDVNTYTPGYLGVRSIPAFVVVTPDRRLIGPEVNSETEKLIDWIKTNVSPAK